MGPRSKKILAEKSNLPSIKKKYEALQRQKELAEQLKAVTAQICREHNYTSPITRSTAGSSSTTKTVSNKGPDTLSTEEVSSTVSGSSTSSILPKDSTPVKKTTVKKRVLRTRRRTVSTQTNFEEKKPRTKKFPKAASVNGRRIIEFQYFFNTLKDLNNHSVAGCNLSNMIITKEEKKGIRTTYTLKCEICNFEKAISSENPCNNSNLNTDFVSGILGMKGSFQDSAILLAKMHLPIIKQVDFIEQCENIVSSNNINKKPYQKTLYNFIRNVYKESPLNAVEQSSSTPENIPREPQLTTTTQESSSSSSSSDGSDLFEQVDLGSLLVEEQIEIKKEIVSDSENEFETSIPNQTAKTSDNKLIAGQKQVILNATTIKQEVIESESDIVGSDRTVRISNNKLIAGQEQIILNTIKIKQEIISDDESFTEAITKETTTKESAIINDVQAIVRTLTPEKEAKTCENSRIDNQAHSQKNVVSENNIDSNILVKPAFFDIERTDKKGMTDFNNKPESELPLKKGRTRKKSKNSTGTKIIPTTTPSKEINVFQSRLESNGLVTAASTTRNLRKRTETSMIANAENATVASSIKTRAGRKVPVSVPVQHMPKSNESGALMIPEMPLNIANGT